jgi:hypothetical protein
MPPSRSPGDFLGPELAASPDSYAYELPTAVRTELATLLAAIARGEAVEPEIRAVMADANARTVAALAVGPGLILVRGVPVEGHAPATLSLLFMAIGRALGQPMPQNLDGETITDIRDTGDDPKDPEVRLYRTRAEQDFHTDGADVIGLMSLQTAKRGGASRIVSSVRVYQAMRCQRPDLAELLLQPWFFRIPGAKARGLPEALPRPIVTLAGDTIESFYIGWYIRNAQGVAGVPALTGAQREALALYEATANDPAHYLDMDFRPGDVQWLRNCFVLHKRTAYEDHAAPDRKRHLLRLWLAMERLADGTPRFPIGGGAPR